MYSFFHFLLSRFHGSSYGLEKKLLHYDSARSDYTLAVQSGRRIYISCTATFFSSTFQCDLFSLRLASRTCTTNQLHTIITTSTCVKEIGMAFDQSDTAFFSRFIGLWRIGRRGAKRFTLVLGQLVRMLSRPLPRDIFSLFSFLFVCGPMGRGLGFAIIHFFPRNN